MANYKVPQDVEADDKLIGPFSFRQFIYLVIVALAIAMGYGLSRLYIALAIIPLPIVVFFGALALPLRKDQPMEIYLAAMIAYYLKPHRRIWDPDGIESLIEITAPKIPEIQRTKDISQDEAQRRLSYLADIVDTQGWAVRGVETQPMNTPMKSDAYFEAQQASDMLDESNIITQTFDTKLEKSDSDRHEAMAKILTGAQPTTNYFGGPVSEPAPAPEPVLDMPINISYNPYPEIQQSVIQPLSQHAAAKPPVVEQPVEPAKPVEQPKPDTSEIESSADIMKQAKLKILAGNNDLDIATLAREANRDQNEHEMEQEVVISLR